MKPEFGGLCVCVCVFVFFGWAELLQLGLGSTPNFGNMKGVNKKSLFWSNYSDLTRPHPKWWFSKGIPLISGKSRLVKYYNLAKIVAVLVISRSMIRCLQGN